MNASSNSSPRDSERERLNAFPKTSDSQVWTPGVLLADEIERCCKQFSLIFPFTRDQLKAASYRLTVGSRYSLGGKRQTLGESEEITIPQFQVAVIQTRETLNLPRNMIARWNIKVKRAYEGLIWAGGPQVDPGYVGHLFCPIYNLSNEPVTLAYGAEIAVIDFVTTTPFKESYENRVEFGRPPKDLLFEDYPTLESGPFKIWDKIQGFESRIEKIDTRTWAIGGFAVTLIGIIIAALSFMANASAQPLRSLKFSEWVCLLFSGIAVGLSRAAWIRARGHHKHKEPDITTALVMILVGIFLGVLTMFFAMPLASR